MTIFIAMVIVIAACEGACSDGGAGVGNDNGGGREPAATGRGSRPNGKREGLQTLALAIGAASRWP